MPLDPPQCEGVDCGRPIVNDVLFTVELCDRGPRQSAPPTILRLCRRCYAVGGYATPTSKDKTNG